MINIEKKKIANILERHGVVAGYLFGSAARGAMGPHSDIDVAVLFDEKKVQTEKQFDEKLRISEEIARDTGVREVDVINLSTATDPLIKYIAVFSGKLIFEMDKRKRSVLEEKIVRDYENTRELRRIARSVMKRQLQDGLYGRASTMR